MGHYVQLMGNHLGMLNDAYYILQNISNGAKLSDQMLSIRNHAKGRVPIKMYEGFHKCSLYRQFDLISRYRIDCYQRDEPEEESDREACRDVRDLMNLVRHDLRQSLENTKKVYQLNLLYDFIRGQCRDPSTCLVNHMAIHQVRRVSHFAIINCRPITISEFRIQMKHRQPTRLIGKEVYNAFLTFALYFLECSASYVYKIRHNKRIQNKDEIINSTIDKYAMYTMRIGLIVDSAEVRDVVLEELSLDDPAGGKINSSCVKADVHYW